MATHDALKLTLHRRILENPDGEHIRRMRAAIWLYLEILSRLPEGGESVPIEPEELSRVMGLPVGTIRSWLGHLRKSRYIDLSGQGSPIEVRVRHVPHVPASPPPARFFTVRKLQEALGEREGVKALESALEGSPDEAIRKALAGALAVPAEQIRRSRTALFLYLLKRNTHET